MPRAARRYVLEREGETAWTMHLTDGGQYEYLPEEITAQVPRATPTRAALTHALSLLGSIRSLCGPAPLPCLQVERGEHVGHTFNPNARAWDMDSSDEPPPEYKPPSLLE